MKKILFCLLLLPCLIQAQRLTVDSVLLKKQGVIPAKWVSVKTFSAIDTINEIQTLYNHNLYDIKRVDTTTRTKVLTRKTTDSLINYALTGVVDTKGNWDASGNTLPSTNVKTGDKYTISVKGLVTDSLYVGDVIIAKVDNPGQTITNWNHIYVNQPRSVNLVLASSNQVGAIKYTAGTNTEGAFTYNTTYALYSDKNLGFFGRLSAYRFNANVFAALEPATKSTTYVQASVFEISSNYIQGTLLSPAGGGTCYIFGTTSNHTSGNLIEVKNYGSIKLNIGYNGYIYNEKPTFSSVFWDSTRLIALDQNTPVIVSNTWGNLWPNTKLVGFTENKDTAIVSYAGNYNLTFDFNSNVSASANFHYYIKKRAANSTTKTTVYRKEVSNSGTTVNRNMTLNYDFSVGDRIWIEVENISNGTDITVYGGTYSITANYLNP